MWIPTLAPTQYKRTNPYDYVMINTEVNTRSGDGTQTSSSNESPKSMPVPPPQMNKEREEMIERLKRWEASESASTPPSPSNDRNPTLPVIAAILVSFSHILISSMRNLAERALRVKTRLRQWMQKPQGRRISRVASIVLLLALLAGGIALLITYLPASTATVTITPMSKRVTRVHTITLNILGTEDLGVGWIRGRGISYTTQEQSQTVPGTGKKHLDATQATGTVVISQIHISSQSHNNSWISESTISANDGTKITISGFTATDGGSLTVNAKASSTGKGGNIPAYAIDGKYDIYQESYYCIIPNPLTGSCNDFIGTAYVQNPSAFTGGWDAGEYAYIRQGDIDGVVNALSAQLTPDARQQVQQQLQSEEQFVPDFTCNEITETDHKSDEIADYVTVKVKVKCTGYAYKPKDVIPAAINAYKASTVTQLGASYQLSGAVTTGEPRPSSGLSFEVLTDGIWVFQISGAQQQEIAQSIAGRSQRDATDHLLQHKGIKSVVLTTAGSIGTALPTSPGNIKVIIVPISGLTSG
jgi:hypothetical protein